MSCVWERGHIACNTWKTKMKNLLGTHCTYNTEFPRLNWTDNLSAKRLAEMRSLLGCEQFLTQYFLAGNAKNGGASRNERHKERAFLDILETGCNKDRTRDSSLSLASQWYIEHGNHLHLRGAKTQNFPGSNFLCAKTLQTKCAIPFLTTSLKSALLPLTTLPKNA